MLQPATREYSDSFVPIDIFELSDEDIRLCWNSVRPAVRWRKRKKFWRIIRLPFWNALKKEECILFIWKSKKEDITFIYDKEGKVKIFF